MLSTCLHDYQRGGQRVTLKSRFIRLHTKPELNINWHEQIIPSYVEPTKGQPSLDKILNQSIPAITESLDQLTSAESCFLYLAKGQQ